MYDPNSPQQYPPPYQVDQQVQVNYLGSMPVTMPQVNAVLEGYSSPIYQQSGSPPYYTQSNPNIDGYPPISVHSSNSVHSLQPSPQYGQSLPQYSQSTTTTYTQVQPLSGLQYGQYEQYPIQTQEQIQEAQLNQFFIKYDISRRFQEDIEEVTKYDIIIIADDSTSMSQPSSYLSFESNKTVHKTRWDELKETVDVVTELAMILDDDGIDVRFLNDSSYYRNIKSHDQVVSLFNRKPQGRTPLTRVLREVMNMRSNKPKLILVITDGEPNDDNGYADTNNFCRLLKNRDAKNNRVSILACTTSDTQMDWLNKVDKDAEHVDVIDDYLSERDQILAVQGRNFTYSHGDHVIKMLLGPLLQKYDDLDEKKFDTGNTLPRYTTTNYTSSSYNSRANNYNNNNYGEDVGCKNKKCTIF